MSDSVLMYEVSKFKEDWVKLISDSTKGERLVCEDTSLHESIRERIRSMVH
jgi:hypothetical protein